MGELVSLPENTWIITNSEGVYQHFEFKHHMKSKVINNTGWQELSDIISIPTFTKPNVSKEIEDDEENYFNFIDAEGNLTDQSHYFFYCMTAVFCVSSVLICIFRRQLMQLCNCCCPRPIFTPKVTYHTSNEKLNIVDVNNMKNEK